MIDLVKKKRDNLLPASLPHFSASSFHNVTPSETPLKHFQQDARERSTSNDFLARNFEIFCHHFTGVYTKGVHDLLMGNGVARRPTVDE